MKKKLLEIRIELEKLITKREGYVAENAIRKTLGQSPAYDKEAFANISTEMGLLLMRIL